MGKIADGEWDDDIEEKLGDAIAEAIDDFGPDFHEDGTPVEEGESDRIHDEGEREKEGRTCERATTATSPGVHRRLRGRLLLRRGGVRGGRGGGQDHRLAGGARTLMATQTDTKNRISSVKNIQKITRAMEMVAAARLRKAEQRIEDLRPYARAIRRMTQRVVDAVEKIPSLPAARGARVRGQGGHPAGHRRPRPGRRLQLPDPARGQPPRERAEEEGKELVWYASGRRGVSSLEFRGRDVAGAWTGFTDRPAFSDAREIAEDISAQYIDGKVDRVEMIYNGYVSAMTQKVSTDVLLPLAAVEQLMEDEDGDEESEDDTSDERESGHKTLWIYEPDPEEILQRLVPDYIEISIYRALLESTASEHGSRMTAMRSAQENASELIDDLTLQMNRQRQAEITQEIMEVVAGAEGLADDRLQGA